MAWLRIGDNCSTHPIMSRLLAASGLDHQQKNEAFGALAQMAAVSAGHLLDGIIEMGLLAQIAPGRERAVLNLLIAAGVAAEVKHDGRTVIKLILDDEEFIHARRREEVELDRNRAKDKRTPGLLAQVRVRDGDACRWCGKSVSWKNRSGFRAATYDSLNNHVESTLDTLVVACKSCNSKRGAGQELTLRPAPKEKIYSEQTVSFVNSDEWCQHNGIRIGLSSPPLPIDLPASQESQGSAHVAAHHEDPVAPPAGSSAPAASSQSAGAPPNIDDKDVPKWVTASSEEIREMLSPASQEPQGSAHAAAHHEDPVAPPAGSSAPVASSQSAGAPQKDDPPRPRSDLGRQGDVSRTLGTGRDGQGRDGQESVRHAGKKRRRRGSRGGKK